MKIVQRLFTPLALLFILSAGCALEPMAAQQSAEWSISKEYTEYWDNVEWVPMEPGVQQALRAVDCRHLSTNLGRDCGMKVRYRIVAHGPAGASADLFHLRTEACKELPDGIDCERGEEAPSMVTLDENGEAVVEGVEKYGFIYYMTCGQPAAALEVDVQVRQGERVLAQSENLLWLDATRCPTRVEQI